ncbi:MULTISPECIES: NUDIX hydrolase [unclassified Staphylococcus]|uniref:NUDIX hydrolase n=1 Tax=unclassified Staphylococcus TaxID=91994 RepID=UPI0021D38F2D|nr:MULTISPECIES: NUDIX hydrolase [unclassified Staphylococcus]UXR78748.1 NUDIX hydrolase [Staphylococcus sp. IVB6227]UXR82907.1 NUDIX hydrolase [Staphylococcus sp. IVB6214]
MKCILFGFGKQAENLYHHYLNDASKFEKIIIVDLYSAKAKINKLLTHCAVDYETYFLDDAIQHMRQLPPDIYKALQHIVKNYDITHAVITTESRSHDVYIDFCLNMHLNILCDPPLTLPMYTNTLVGAYSIKENYEKIIEKWQASTPHLFEIYSLKRAHMGYQYVYHLLEQIVSTYRVPIQHIHMSYSNHMIESSNDVVLKESNPYKYGYGKLMHDGYHLIDLLTFFTDINKKHGFIEHEKVFHVSDYRPSDFYPYYGKVLNDKLSIPTDEKIYQNLNILKYFGEFGLNTFIDYIDASGHKITTASLHISQSAHAEEVIEINMGPLLTIKIISNPRHQLFDIHLYKNTQLLDGEPFEVIQLKDIDVSSSKYPYENQPLINRDILDKFFIHNQSHTNILDYQEQIEILAHIHHQMAQDIDMSSFRFAVELIIEHNGKFLICRRRPDVEVAPGLWNVPAGKVQYNESMDAAIIREAKEETNLDISEFQCLGYEFINKAHQRCVYTYHVKINDISHLRIDTGEFDQYVWVDAMDVNQYESLNPHIRDAIVRLHQA